MNIKSEKLPYRETSDVFLIYKGKLVARIVKNANTNSEYLSVPGGGIDEGETPLQGAKRECMEEVGAKLKSLYLVSTVDQDWFPEWADTPKRKDRYKQFRGERIHLLIGIVDKFEKATSDEDDDWKGKKTLSISKVVKFLEDNLGKDHPNMYAYRIAQLTIAKMLHILKYK